MAALRQVIELKDEEMQQKDKVIEQKDELTAKDKELTAKDEELTAHQKKIALPLPVYHHANILHDTCKSSCKHNT